MRFQSIFFVNEIPAVQKGVSLVELLVALALSATLILGIFTVYMDSNQTSRMSTSLARIQESARVSLDILSRDIRMAGFIGCLDPGKADSVRVIANNPPVNILNSMQDAIRAWEVTGSGWAAGTELPDSIKTAARVGSDVIAIQRGDIVDVRVTGNNISGGNANIQVAGTDVDQFEQSDMVLIADCESGDLFRISSTPGSNTWAHANNVNSDNRLSQAYNEEARVMRFSSTFYYVADTNRDDGLGNDIYALFRARNNLVNETDAEFHVDELVEGVESIQVELGERLGQGGPTNNIRYVKADVANLDRTKVEAARIGLLVSDAERVRDDNDTASYELPGELITPSSGNGAVKHAEDRRLRRSFTSTIALRNRLQKQP